MARTVVLLGAGASMDAGMPLTSQFAAQLVDQMNKDLGADAPQVQALNFIYSAMVSSRGDRGRNPLEAVNVETMISAIRLLRNRNDHEAAPFVTSWKPGVSAFGGIARGSTGQSNALVAGVSDALGVTFPNGDRLRDAIFDIAETVAGRRDNSSLFEEIETELLVRVRRLLLKPARSVDYLGPIARLAETQEGGLDVATLNYDRTLEIAAASLSIPVNTGIADWRPGEDFSFAPNKGVVNLLKIHGSIDWQRVRSRPERGARSLASTRLIETNEFRDHDVPAIVIGDREKLASGGPILALLHAFEAALRRADRLVVVGYGFLDQHVNAVIRDWLAVPDRSITVLDPGWPRIPSGYIGTDDAGWAILDTFQQELAWNLGMQLPGGGDTEPPRLNVIRKGARDGLEEALTTWPSLEPVPRFRVTTTYPQSDAAEAIVEIENLGSDLTEITISPYYPGTLSEASRAELRFSDPPAGAGTGWPDKLTLPTLLHGDILRISMKFASPPDTRRPIVTVSGNDVLNHTFEIWEGEAGHPGAPLARRDPSQP